MPNNRFACEQNIIKYKRLLERETRQDARRVLQELLRSEQEKARSQGWPLTGD